MLIIVAEQNDCARMNMMSDDECRVSMVSAGRFDEADRAGCTPSSACWRRSDIGLQTMLVSVSDAE